MKEEQEPDETQESEIKDNMINDIKTQFDNQINQLENAKVSTAFMRFTYFVDDLFAL